ncbi:MAG TPA: DUF6351 family protein [Mycobacteriales bacterium]|nr:DUF6351 family protein [Mycobacteriales bacterium]
MTNRIFAVVVPVLGTVIAMGAAVGTQTSRVAPAARAHHARVHQAGVQPEASLAGDGPHVVRANDFTYDAAGLRPGQVEMTTVSARPTLITGHDATLAIRGLTRGDRLHVTVNGRTVPARAFHRHASLPGQAFGQVLGVLHHLPLGTDEVHATVTGKRYGTRRMSLALLVHSLQGPIITGPHQEPFICETQAGGLGPSHGKNCTAKQRIHWWYKDVEGNFHRLKNPYAPYPSAVTTTNLHGHKVPFVVRVQNVVINRSVTRLAVLDDPHARGRHSAFHPRDWNRKMVWHFGESCGTGYDQGSDGGEITAFSPISSIGGENLAGPLLDLPGLLSRGYMVGESSLTIFGVHCNQVLSAETLMMVREFVTNHYGLVHSITGGGGSGGAIQQYTIANGYPGVLDAGTPILSFPDVVTTAMTVGDCVVLRHYFNSHKGWGGGKQIAVTGLASKSSCDDWNDLFGGNLKPTSCPGAIPDAERYNPQTNPHGVRCDLQDDLKNILGTDPKTGAALRPLDNVGVQYGLEALRSDRITPSEFVSLNRGVGGVDLDGNFMKQRESMSAYEARRIFSDSLVGEYGAINEAPIIDQTIPLTDDIPTVDIHDQIRPYEIRARLEQNYGSYASQAIWSGAPLPSSAILVAEQWLNDIDKLQAHYPYKSRAWLVAHARPTAAQDQCRVGGTGAPVECSVLMHSGPRQMAGGPMTEDDVKCRLRPLHRSDYPASLTASQFKALKRIFPTGVCAYHKHSVGWVRHSRTWVSFGDTTLYRTPVVVPYPLVRSEVPSKTTRP